jgi:hypothetical protein
MIYTLIGVENLKINFILGDPKFAEQLTEAMSIHVRK